MTTTTSTAINQLNVQQAVAEAIAEEMRRDPRVMMFGEGVATKRPELVAEFGAERVRNTPLAEAIIAGTAVGAAAMGMRPIVDLLFAPFLTLSMDALVNSAGKLRYLSGGQFSFPLVVLTMTGAGWGVGGAAQPQPRGDVRARAGAEGRDAVERGRLQGPAQGGDPRRQPGPLLHGPGARPHAGRRAGRRAPRSARPRRRRPRGHRSDDRSRTRRRSVTACRRPTRCRTTASTPR